MFSGVLWELLSKGFKLTETLTVRGRRPVRIQGWTWLSSVFCSSVKRGCCFCMALRAARSSFNTVSLSLLQNTFTWSVNSLHYNLDQSFTVSVIMQFFLCMWCVTFCVIMGCIKVYVWDYSRSVMVLHRDGNQILDMIWLHLMILVRLDCLCNFKEE